MPEPTSTAAIAVTATGLSILGIATGLQPNILLAGFAGGLWALSYQPELPVLRSVASTLGASIVAGYLAPIVVAILRPALPGDLSHDIAQTASALVVGLLSQRIIGPAIFRIAKQKAEDAER